MSAAIVVRRAVPGDYEAICELADLMDAPQREALPDRFRKPSGPVRLRGRTEKLMHDPDTFLAVAELDSRVVGVTNCGLLRMGDFPQKHLGETRSSKSEFRFKLECSNADRPDSFDISGFNHHSRFAIRNCPLRPLPAAVFFATLGLAPLSHRFIRRFDA